MTRKNLNADDVRTSYYLCFLQPLKIAPGRSTGRKCDGYAAVSPNSKHITATAAELVDEDDDMMLIPAAVSPRSPQRKEDARSLEYFHYNTVSALFGFIETDIWARLVPQLSESEPAIKSAMSALSSFHELCNKHSFDKVFTRRTGDDGLALQQYNRAINQLRSRMAEGPTSKTVALVSCLLFTCLEFVRGDRSTALLHLKSGMNILRLQSRSGESAQTKDDSEQSLASLFSRISLLCTIYGQPRESRYIDLLTVEQESVLQFTSLDQARTAMVNLTNAVMGTAYYMDFSLFPSQLDADIAQISCLEGIKQWNEALKPLLDNSSDNRRGALAIKSLVTLAYIWISRYGGRRDECAFDDYVDNFREIVENFEYVLSDAEKRSSDGSPTSLPSFTIDTGMHTTLYFTANKCRDRLLRRRAVELLKRSPRREGLYDAVELSNVCQFIIDTEEEGLPPLPCEDLPGEARRVGDYVVCNRDPKTNKQEVRLYHGLSKNPETWLATRVFDYDELTSDMQQLEV